jgi:hypothetical protein
LIEVGVKRRADGARIVTLFTMQQSLSNEYVNFRFA